MFRLIDTPFTLTMQAVIAMLGHLKSNGVTLGAGAAFMEPVPVTIERILDNIVIHRQRERIPRRERFDGVFPGFAFHVNQLNVSVVGCVSQDPMRQFV